MTTHLYLSMIPESLIVSMLPPEEFGTYLAVGTQKRSRGQAMFFNLKPDFRDAFFDVDAAARRCVPHPDGQPKHSVYVAVYRVLEHVPLDAVGSLWLATRDGRILELAPSSAPRSSAGKFHLYQEACPVHPQIASRMNPQEFCRFITDPARPFHVPRICFAELDLAELADDPEFGRADDLPYPNLGHLRDCLIQLGRPGGAPTKTVDRTTGADFPYRLIRGGFWLGDPRGCRHYPFPSREELDSKHHDWWRSANA
jgi:hypothetical protein